MLARDDQQVAARGRVDVHEGDRPLVLGTTRRRDLAGDDLAEEAVGVVHAAHRTRYPWRSPRAARFPAACARPSSTSRAIDRPSASDGERPGRRVDRDRLGEASGFKARIEQESGHRLVRHPGRADVAPRGRPSGLSRARAAARRSCRAGGGRPGSPTTSRPAPHLFRRLAATLREHVQRRCGDRRPARRSRRSSSWPTTTRPRRADLPPRANAGVADKFPTGMTARRRRRR